jgi:pimeloyl-ACP methyl ester carboxylesterase
MHQVFSRTETRSTLLRSVALPAQISGPAAGAASEGDLDWPEPRPLSALTMPVLVIIGERGTDDLKAIAQRIAREAPDARLKVIAKRVASPELPATGGVQPAAARIRGMKLLREGPVSSEGQPRFG